MNNIFQVGPTARRPDEAPSDQLFVGELAPHNAERPWLSIRGVGAATGAGAPRGVAIVAETASIPVERG